MPQTYQHASAILPTHVPHSESGATVLYLFDIKPGMKKKPVIIPVTKKKNKKQIKRKIQRYFLLQKNKLDFVK